MRALGLVGSHARGAARADSDVDILVLADEALDVDALGGELIRTRRWGVLTEYRYALADGLELDVGVAPTSWASVDPLDPGTARVVRDGLRILHDPDGLLGALVYGLLSSDKP